MMRKIESIIGDETFSIQPHNFYAIELDSFSSLFIQHSLSLSWSTHRCFIIIFAVLGVCVCLYNICWLVDMSFPFCLDLNMEISVRSYVVLYIQHILQTYSIFYLSKFTRFLANCLIEPPFTSVSSIFAAVFWGERFFFCLNIKQIRRDKPNWSIIGFSANVSVSNGIYATKSG